MFRLIFVIILFVFSLLTIFPAPTYHLWLLAIIVTEYSPVFIAITVVSFLWISRGEKLQLPAAGVTIAALLLYAVPLVQAKLVAEQMSKELTQAFSADRKVTVDINIFNNIIKLNTQKLDCRTFVYESFPGKKLKLDFYASRQGGKRPCVVVVHGGSWKSGDNKQLPELNSCLSAAGYNVAAVNYRLAPEFKNPTPVEDVESALGYLKLNAQTLSVDTSNFVLLGRSAGAQIALLAAYTTQISGVKGVVDFYGPADMVWGYSKPSNPLVMNSRKVMEDYLGGTYQSVPQLYRQSSPLLYVKDGSVPTLIIHGKNDVLVAYEHSLRLESKLAQHKVPHYFLSLPWATHGFDFNINGPGGQLSTTAVLSFLSYVTNAN